MLVETFSLFELNEHIRRVVALNFEAPLWVRCEISQVGESRGHRYLGLIDKDPEDDHIKAQSNGVLWARQYFSLRKKYGEVLDDIMQDGVDVRIKVSVDFHERYGLKLVVEDVDPSYTMGNLELQRREILEKLEKKNLIGKNALLPVPPVLQRLAVLSAEHAAGYQDFKEHLTHNPYGYYYDIDLYTVALQGNNVESEIVTALKQVNRAAAHYDCVIIIRGGGSRLDLGSFDSYAIGEAIAHAKLPVLSGIGHEVDNTVVDVVANQSLKTPTAVANMLIDHNLEYEGECNQFFDQIAYQIESRVTRARNNLQNAETMLAVVPRTLIENQDQRLTRIVELLQQRKKEILNYHATVLDHASNLTQAIDPVRTLERGFSITRVNGQALRSVKDARSGDQITTQVADGTINSTVE